VSPDRRSTAIGLSDVTADAKRMSRSRSLQAFRKLRVHWQAARCIWHRLAFTGRPD
jgi:hypothetical protein